MRHYVLTTGIIFALVFCAHIARVVSEGTWLLKDPFWDLLTAMAAALSVWAWRIWRSLAES